MTLLIAVQHVPSQTQHGIAQNAIVIGCGSVFSCRPAVASQVLKQSGNLLLLDEPTNDLDVDTLRALETAIDSFAGSSMIISHDRWFLDRLATHILAFEGDSEVVWFEGSYSEYAADRQTRLGKVEPTRIKYRKLATA